MFLTFTAEIYNLHLMKHFFVLFFVFLLLNGAYAQKQETYRRVRIKLEGKDLALLGQAGIDLSEGIFKAGESLQTDLSVTNIARIEAAGFEVETLINDVAAYYQQRFDEASGTTGQRNPADEFPVPANWEYGSMGGFYTYDQVLAKLDFMAAQWPNLISVRQAIDPLNLSHQGNPVWWVKISDNPDINEDEPEVLYTSLIHAREGIGVQQMIFFMLHLLENYESNPNIQALVNNRELYFVPVVNPDGYKYNQQTNPSGGGMWRKNRRNNGGSYGVDLNRNFGYKWGLDNTGSSPYPSDDTYRGPSPFSEPETQNLKKFVEEHHFTIALNYHSYSNLLLYPWGYTDVPCPDDAIFHTHATMMTRDNNYTFGPACTTIYPTNGGSDDYMYGDTETRNSVFAYTAELGSSSDGFWPSMNRIIPLCQENMIQNMYAAYLAGGFGKISDLSEPIIGQKNFKLHFGLQRVGFGESNGWTVRIVPVDDIIVAVDEPVQIASLNMFQTIEDSIGITLNDQIQSGAVFKFLLQLDNGEYVISDTITKMFGTTTTLLDDNCNQLIGWTSTNWGISTSSFVSAPASITDSPSGNYASNANTSITLTQPVNLPETPYAMLSYWAKWDIEKDWDYVQVLIKPTGTFQWVPLTGLYTIPGGSNQLPGQPLYDGTSGWVKEQIDLTQYAGSSFQLKFALTSDGSVVGDGFYFDDIKVVMLNVETSIDETKTKPASLNLFPNPANTSVVLSTEKGFKQGDLIQIVDMQGRVLLSYTSGHSTTQIELSVAEIPAGVYLVHHQQSGSVPARLIIK